MKLRYVAICLILAVPLRARADTLYWLGAKLPNGATYPDGGGDPMQYWVDETQGTPGGLPVATIEQQTIASYGLWQAVDCAYIGFSFQGAITDPSQLGQHDDRKNVMDGFVNSYTDPRYADDLGDGIAVGVALTYKQNGIILGCDTEFNAQDYTYSDGIPATGEDFLSLANHENGHCLGLDHDPNDFNSVMYPTEVVGDLRRTLDPHDIDNVCQLYPETGSIGSPCSGSSCGGSLSCIQDPINGGNFCSHSCDASNPSTCEAGFGCRASQAIAGASAACFPGDGDFSPNIGDPCGADTDCHGANAMCITGWSGGYCSQYCDSSTCPTGDVCAQLDAQHFYCTSACTTYAGGCRAGYACFGYDTGGDGFCIPACAQDADCGGTDLCLADGICYPPGNAGSYVGHACLSSTDCPTGDFCIPASDSSGHSTGWPGGYCAAPCGAGQDANRPCGAGATCVIAGAEGQAYCLQNCDAQGGCRQGYTCVVKPDASHTEQQVCAPGCASDSDCAVGERCTGGACVDPNGGSTGSCTLCGDGGITQTTTGSGSTGSSSPPPATPSGCGCGAGGSVDLMALGVLMCLLGARRRRAW
ncbi:MAG: matrixin family metalloprotease [Deltaproteobacteria bacterium]|nr:matrixin family metalloprotease [Deltaproteobacteria bacterium]